MIKDYGTTLLIDYATRNHIDDGPGRPPARVAVDSGDQGDGSGSGDGSGGVDGEPGDDHTVRRCRRHGARWPNGA